MLKEILLTVDNEAELMFFLSTQITIFTMA